MHSLFTFGLVLAFTTLATAEAATTDAGRPLPSTGQSTPAMTRSIYEDFATLAGASYRVRGLAAPRDGSLALDDHDSLPALIALGGIGFDDGDRPATTTAAVIVPDEAHREDPPGKTSGDPRAVAMPDPGTVQVFGLGLVILAMVAGSVRREPSFGR